MLKYICMNKKSIQNNTNHSRNPYPYRTLLDEKFSDRIIKVLSDTHTDIELELRLGKIEYKGDKRKFNPNIPHQERQYHHH